MYNQVVVVICPWKRSINLQKFCELKFGIRWQKQYNTIQYKSVLHWEIENTIQHFKQTNLYTIYENMIFGGTWLTYSEWIKYKHNQYLQRK